MNKYQKINVLNIVVIIAMVAFGLSQKSSLPEMIPTKFDDNGVAIAFAPFMSSVFFLPLIAAITVFLLTFFSKKNKSFWSNESNREAVAQTHLGINVLIASMYVGTFLNAVNYSQYFKYSFFSIGFGLFFLVSATAMKKIERNLIYGVRLPWTLTSEVNWKKTHELTTPIMLASGVVLVLAGFFTKSHAVILTLISITFLIPSLYSFKIRKLA